MGVGHSLSRSLSRNLIYLTLILLLNQSKDCSSSNIMWSNIQCYFKLWHNKQYHNHGWIQKCFPGGSVGYLSLPGEVRGIFSVIFLCKYKKFEFSGMGGGMGGIGGWGGTGGGVIQTPCWPSSYSTSKEESKREASTLLSWVNLLTGEAATCIYAANLSLNAYTKE